MKNMNLIKYRYDVWFLPGCFQKCEGEEKNISFYN